MLRGILLDRILFNLANFCNLILVIEAELVNDDRQGDIVYFEVQGGDSLE